MAGIAYVNGTVTAIEEARVPVEDRGLQFGDSVYEVVQAHAGAFFRLGPHLERLMHSLQAVEMPAPMPPEELAGVATGLLHSTGWGEAVLYVQVTRGTAPRQHTFPPVPVPTLIMTLRPREPADAAPRRGGVRLVTHQDLRWARRDIKATTLLPNVLARERAARAGAQEALLYEADGTITECTAANAFAVIDGRLRTHPADAAILHGVTRAAALEVCRALRIPCEERALRLADLPAASEVFITGSGIGVLPVGQIDAEWRRDPGPVTGAIRAAYGELVERETRRAA